MVHSLLFFYFAAKVEPPKKMKNCQAREFPIVIIGKTDYQWPMQSPAPRFFHDSGTIFASCLTKITKRFHIEWRLLNCHFADKPGTACP